MKMPLETAFSTQLALVSRRWRTQFDAELRAQETGLTMARGRTLLMLATADGPVTQNDIAESLAIEHPTVVRLLDGMQKAGLIERRPLAGDRRANQIVLTASAVHLAAKVEAISADIRMRFLKGVDPADLAAAVRVLTTISRNLETS